MSRELVVNVWCDFPHSTPAPATEHVLAVGEGKPPKAVGACDACDKKYLAPLRDAYAAGADVGPLGPPAEQAPKQVRVSRPAPNDGQCSECPRQVLNFVGWVQHMQRTHGWERDKRDAWLVDNGYEPSQAAA